MQPLFAQPLGDIVKAQIKEYHETNVAHTIAQDSTPADTSPEIEELERKLERLGESIKQAAENNPEIKTYENYPFNN